MGGIGGIANDHRLFCNVAASLFLVESSSGSVLTLASSITSADERADGNTCPESCNWKLQ